MLVIDMTNTLSQLVGEKEQLFRLMIQQLEIASGGPAVDIRLSAEMVSKIYTHIRALGLDPEDTTGKELYAALNSLVSLHDQFLVKRLGGSNTGDIADLLPRIRKLLNIIDIPKNVWAIKPSIIKKLLKASPPKKVMKQLGYRSIDSMIKREHVGEILIGIRLLESQQWQEAFIQKYQRLQPSDFETRNIEFLLLDGKKWGSRAATYVQSHHQNVSHLKEFGIVAMLPLPVNNLPGITIALLPRLLYYMNEVRTYSSYFKHHQVRTGFGELLVKTLIEDPSRHITIAGQHMHWRVVHHYYGTASSVHPDLFEPHIQPEDLFWRKAEDILYKIEPALHFWDRMDYVGVLYDGIPISFNLMDVAANYVNKIPYEQRFYGHMRDSIWNELFLRYLDHKSIQNQLHMQIDNQTYEPIII